MCKFMKVSCNSYYEWLNNPGCNSGQKDQELILMIKNFLLKVRCNYGSRSIKAKMEQSRKNISRHKVIRLMRKG